MKRVLAVLTVLVPLSATAWEDGWDSPHDDQHVIIARPNDFSSATNDRVTLKHAVFGEAVRIRTNVHAGLNVHHPGEYELWIRAAQPGETSVPLAVEVLRGREILSRGNCNADAGSADEGGRRGFEAYRDVASTIGPDGKRISRTMDSGMDAMGIDEDLSNQADEMLAGLADDSEKARNRWVHSGRLEDPGESPPFYWWKVGRCRLEPGDLALHVRAPKSTDPDAAPLIDAAFLTTFAETVYPCRGDIDARPASYLRFRIDRVPQGADAMQISAGMQIHHDPWYAGATFGANGLAVEKSEPHVETGYTRWYRLQDIENGPGFGGQCSINLRIPEGARGATQFAVYPHGDYVLREINWSGVDGRRYSVDTNFKANLHLLGTLRDHARRNYEHALSATRGRIFPLTRPPLLFANGWGNATGPAADYMLKTLRLLGINSCSAPDPVANARRYGWSIAEGHFWPPAWMPYDEPATREQYITHYRKHFANSLDRMRGAASYQVADEPQQIGGRALAAPLWVYEEETASQPAAWYDPTGATGLRTKRFDFRHCVLEGVVANRGGSFIEFQVGVATTNSRHGYWQVGDLGKLYGKPMNFGFGVQGRGNIGKIQLAGASIARDGTPFKVVYQGTQAALFIDGRLMKQLTGLPPAGGFAIGGGLKALHALRLRSITAAEKQVEGPGDATAAGGEMDDDLDDMLAEIDGPVRDEFVEIPLKAFVESRWEWTGGSPAAHAGFRRWLQGKGIRPELFGLASWSDVRLMPLGDMAETRPQKQLLYWTRRYVGYLTPRMFSLAAEGIRAGSENPDLRAFVALSGHALYMGNRLPLDMFELAKYPAMTPGISDWMSMGGWRWDSHQAVAYSVAHYNAGARRYGQAPVSFPMMHCVWPKVFRSYTQVANQCKLISYWTYGPLYAATEGTWSDGPQYHLHVQYMNNRAAQVDDVLGPGIMRPSRVAMLYAHSTEYHYAQSSFADKRATFLGLSHEYFQPELVTEDQISEGALEHYDALYVLDKAVTADAQARIETWVRDGGLLWSCADAMMRDELNEPLDGLDKIAGLKRIHDPDRKPSPLVRPVEGETEFREHGVPGRDRPTTVRLEGGTVRAVYGDGAPAWVEKPIGNGRLVYIGHRAGLSYSGKSLSLRGLPVVWADTARSFLTQPLHEASVARDLVLSDPVIMASALSSPAGTVIVLYNMHPGERRNLRVELREPAAPSIVQAFDDMDLVDLPFKYDRGKVVIELDRLNWKGQMIVVRRGAAPADPRLKAMKANVIRMLASDDWQDLSAGAWFAGFHADWHLTPRLEELLSHDHWAVRRSAVEALTRLRSAESADSIRALVDAETDEHVLADALYALAVLGHADWPALCEKLVERSSTGLREKQLLRGSLDRLELLAESAQEPGSDFVSAAAGLAERCMPRRNPALRHLAIELLGQLDPASAHQRALHALAGGTPYQKDWSRWAGVVAANDEAFAAYRDAGMPGPDELFFVVGRIRRGPQIDKRLDAILDATTGTIDGSLAWTLQANGRMIDVLKLRHRLAAPALRQLPYRLEQVYDAGLGNKNLDFYEQWLMDHPDVLKRGRK